MRLEMLEEGKGLRPVQRLLALLIKKMGGNFMPPPVIVMSYRRHMFGKPFGALEQEAMRGTTFWNKGEAELLAAFVASQNACRY